MAWVICCSDWKKAPPEQKVRSGILKTIDLGLTKTSRGVNPAAADCDGAIAMYFSRHEPNPGIVANNETVPSQATVSMLSVQYSLTSRLVCEAATPVAKGTEVKKVGLAA